MGNGSLWRKNAATATRAPGAPDLT